MSPAVFQEGESLIGGMRRCAFDNGLPSVGTVLKDLGLAPHASCNLASRDDVDFGRLAFALRTDPAEIDHRTHDGIEVAAWLRSRRFFGTEVRSCDLSLAARAISPGALEQSAHHRGLWHLALLPFCRDTGELLTDRCARCGHRLEWSAAKRLDHCSTCRRPARFGAVERLDDVTLDATATLTGLLDPSHSARSKAIAALPPALQVVPPGVLFDLAWTLARFATRRDASKRRLDAALPVAAKIDVLQTAAEIVADWPDAFSRAMRKRLAADAGEGRRGLQRLRLQLGPRCRWPEQREVLDRTFPELLEKSLDAARAIHGDAQDGRSASLTLGMAAGLLPRLASSGAVETVGIREGRYVTCGYVGSSMRRLAALRSDCIAMQSVAERLGISLHGVEQLACTGILREQDDAAVPIMYGRRQVSRRDFEELVAAIRTRAQMTTNDPLPLRRALMLVGGREKPWSEILRLVLSGELPSYIADATKPTALLDRLVISKSDAPILPTLVDRREQSTDFLFSDEMPRRDMEEVLNLNPRFVGELLATELAGAKTSSTRVRREHVLAFAAARISPGEVSARFMGFCRRVPTQLTDGTVPRRGPSGWDRIAVEQVLR